VVADAGGGGEGAPLSQSGPSPEEAPHACVPGASLLAPWAPAGHSHGKKEDLPADSSPDQLPANS